MASFTTPHNSHRGLSRPMVHEMSSYLQLWQPFCSAEQDLLGSFGRGHYEEHICEIIWTGGSVEDVI